MDFESAKKNILSRLAQELEPTLFYHNVEHTLNVYESTIQIAYLEGVNGPELNLLLTAALFHDAGMIKSYENHEEGSCAIARETLSSFGYSNNEVKIVTGLIEVTRLPQNAKTKHEGILCDADLDYLGRKDFFIHSFQLQLEWDLHGVKNTSLKEWLQSQVHFLSAHKYFTKSAVSLRNEQKLKNLNELKELLKLSQ